ncbi:MAG: carboxypeptidase regulatory-like domain-containing protein [Acidobacteriaceae bacterium]
MKLISSLSVAALFAASLAAQAATVTGTVTNKTTNKPDAGDAVVLISFQQGMQETARTKTDVRGHFSLDVPDQNLHLIRIDHQKAAYFEPLRPGMTHVNINVYDVAEKVAGVTNEADVIRVEAGPQGLNVVQNYFVKNASDPPRTQFGMKAYEIYLPPGAKIEAAAAAGPQGMPVSSSPMAQKDPGHYAFIFPVRPGETRFQLSYTLPYNGSFKFTPRVALPTENLAIMLPKSMSFDGAGFQPANVDDNAQTFLAKDVQPSQALAFTVSGTGVMPATPAQGASGQASGDQGNGNGGQAVSPESDDRPGGGLGDPIDTPDPLQKYKGWILSGLGLLLVIAMAFFLRTRSRDTVVAGPAMPSPLVPTPLAPAAAAPARAPLLDSLKNELFVLETEHLEGKLSDAEYAEHKEALEKVLRRALKKAAGEDVPHSSESA